jgi:hypothetical protein
MPVSEIDGEIDLKKASPGDRITFKKSINGEEVMIQAVLNNTLVIQMPDDSCLGDKRYSSAAPLRNSSSNISPVDNPSTSAAASSETKSSQSLSLLEASSNSSSNGTPYTLNEMNSLKLTAQLDELNMNQKNLIKRLSSTKTVIIEDNDGHDDVAPDQLKENDVTTDQFKDNDVVVDENNNEVQDLSASSQKIYNAILKMKLTEQFPNQQLTNIEGY